MPQRVRNFKALKGRGAQAELDDALIKVGGRALLEEARLTLPQEMEQRVEQETTAGKTAVYVLADNQLTGVIVLGDSIRDESREAVRQLREQHIQIAMITGDSEAVARWVSQELGIDRYFAQVLPEHKAGKVKELQQAGKRVMMVGDGINDAPALTQADVGVAIGAGTNVAIEAAGIVLVRNDPRDIPRIIQLSRLTYTKMIQNLFWATGYNVVALPLAAGAAVSWGIVLTPAVSAVLMSLSTIVVALNAMLLRRAAL
jgi:Cu2+-exporting ATPase